MKTVVGLYDRFDDAQQTVRELRDAGFRSEDISLVARDANGEYSRQIGGAKVEGGQDLSDGTAAGAGIGAVLGGLGGLLVGLGALAIPGIGPVLAAGPLVTALAGAGVGAVAGGIIGALVDLGIPEEHAQYYAEGVRRGGSLVVVRSDDHLADQAMNIMNRHNPVDVGRRSSDWRAENWTGFDANGEPLPHDSMEFNRMRDDVNVPVTGESHYVDYNVMDREIPATTVTNRDVMMDEDWMPHYTAYLAQSGHDYSYFQPAYQYGYELRSNPQYASYTTWETLEPYARQDWQRRGLTGAWEDVKDAVRYGWQRLTR